MKDMQILDQLQYVSTNGFKLRVAKYNKLYLQ